MKTPIIAGLAAAAVTTVALATPAIATADGAAQYQVTVTNLTRNQRFTPILVASHKPGVQLFELGAAASSELATLAEQGDVAPLTAHLEASPMVREVTNSGALLDPGASVTLTVATGDGFTHLSLASMLIPTNDGFISLNGVVGPNGNKAVTIYSPVYDSGSERNDESCASIPGPHFDECGGPGGGGAPAGDEEGYVHIHAGIHGIADLHAAERDWRNPAARIVIRRVAP
jgi:hypothetical protein